MLNRDDIIKLAREAGLLPDNSVFGYGAEVGDLSRFAALVYEKAWADTALAATRTVTDAAIALEREACAKLCEDCINLQPYPTMAAVADLIRARGNK